MSLPEALREVLEDTVPGLAPIRSGPAIGGGCIHHALRLETAEGPLFCKWNGGEAGAAFGAEARGLGALARAAGDGGIRIPGVRGWRDARGQEPGWLLLEYLPPSAPGRDYDERLGRGLAHLHGSPVREWGWDEPNRIGALPQANAPRPTWSAFWRDMRLEPQIRLAREQGHLRPRHDRELDAALDAVEPLLGPVEGDGPSVVHGDLWAGNVHPGPDGGPVLVDPASYRGHREVDLAMADLFGGLSSRARAAYGEARPLLPGYERRRPLYQLYYLLVHVNLFGAGYLGSTLEAARAAARDR